MRWKDDKSMGKYHVEGEKAKERHRVEIKCEVC
jgi:hypothetical protein